MKRVILGALGVLALLLLALAISGGDRLDGAPRYLIGAGAVVLLIGVVDGFRTGQPTPVSAGTTTTPVPVPVAGAPRLRDHFSAPVANKPAGTMPAPAPESAPAATSAPVAASAPAPQSVPSATAPAAAASPAPAKLIDLRDVIDLTDGDTALVPRSSLLEQFIADGLIRVVPGPLSDDEVHAMVMVAIVDSERLAPELASRPMLQPAVG